MYANFVKNASTNPNQTPLLGNIQLQLPTKRQYWHLLGRQTIFDGGYLAKFREIKV